MPSFKSNYVGHNIINATIEKEKKTLEVAISQPYLLTTAQVFLSL